MFPGRPAPAVSPAKGVQAGSKAILLDPLVPALDHTGRFGLAVVIVVKVRQHFRAVNAFPNKGVIGEGRAAVIGPEDFLRREEPDIAAAHDLRQGAGVAEYIRQPEHFAVHAEFLAVEALTVDQLADQAFAAGDISIRLHPGCTIGDPLAPLGCLADIFIQLRVFFLHHHIQRRLAL